MTYEICVIQEAFPVRTQPQILVIQGSLNDEDQVVESRR